MPIYEYRCESCGHEMEALQKISDDPLTECPSCGQPALKKLISAGGFILKGTGWYQTDFKGNGKKATDKAAGTGAGKTSAAGKADTGAKPASKPTGNKGTGS